MFIPNKKAQALPPFPTLKKMEVKFSQHFFHHKYDTKKFDGTKKTMLTKLHLHFPRVLYKIPSPLFQNSRLKFDQCKNQ